MHLLSSLPRSPGRRPAPPSTSREQGGGGHRKKPISCRQPRLSDKTEATRYKAGDRPTRLSWLAPSACHATSGCQGLLDCPGSADRHPLRQSLPPSESTLHFRSRHHHFGQGGSPRWALSMREWGCLHTPPRPNRIHGDRSRIHLGYVWILEKRTSARLLRQIQIPAAIRASRR
jgi:hypothetical protein